MKLREAYNKYGKLGRELVREVDEVFNKIIKNAEFPKQYRQKVMISGMVYKGDTSQKIFTAVNFTEKEIKAGKLADFIENMHPVLKKRYELHLEEITKGLKATPKNIQRAGIAASHGEVRAVNELLYHIETTGIEVTDGIFNDIKAYNRFFIKEGSQPPCVHCFYLTDGIEYLKSLK